MEKKVLEIIDKLTKHSIDIIRNNGMEYDEFDVDCRSYEEGYLKALADIKESLKM